MTVTLEASCVLERYAGQQMSFRPDVSCRVRNLKYLARMVAKDFPPEKRLEMTGILQRCDGASLNLAKVKETFASLGADKRLTSLPQLHIL